MFHLTYKPELSLFLQPSLKHNKNKTIKWAPWIQNTIRLSKIEHNKAHLGVCYHVWGIQKHRGQYKKANIKEMRISNFFNTHLNRPFRRCIRLGLKPAITLHTIFPILNIEVAN